MTLNARLARRADAPAITEIYNQGIEDRVATFDTVLRSPADIEGWFDRTHPIVVVEDVADESGPTSSLRGSRIVGFAATFTYRPRAAYAGVAEYSVYVARDMRGEGVGRVAMEALVREAADAGLWKLVSRIFVENAASRALMGRAGFREVGIYRRHGKLDGIWRDTVIVELLLGEAAED